jgi:DNA-binding response OmpR family regulator
MITRVFRGRVRPGKHAEFERFILEEGLPRFRETPGVLGVHFGTPTEQNPDEFLVVSVWTDLDALRAFAGDRWLEPKLSLQEAHMLADASVHHYRNGNGHPLGAAETERAKPAGVVDLGPLHVDLARRVAEIEGQVVELPPREFSVLAELALRPGQPVPADELAKLAWPEDSWVTGDDVRRTVYRLRRLIRDHQRDRPMIRNRRGHGYVLQP